MGSVMAKFVGGQAPRRPQEQEPAGNGPAEPHGAHQGGNNKMVVRCGQTSRFSPGNVAYLQEAASFRGRFLDFPEERENILDHFLARFTFLREHSDHPLSEEEARAKVKKSLSDQRKQLLSRSEPAAAAAARPRPVVSVTPRRAHSHKTRFAVKTARSIVPQQLLLRQEEPSEEEDSFSDDDTSHEEDDGASSVGEQSLGDSPGQERLPIVRCGRNGSRFRLLPGNQAYQQLVQDLRDGYLEAEPSSEGRKLMVDHILQHFNFLRGDTNDRLSTRDAKAKIIKSLIGNTSRKPAPTQQVTVSAPNPATKVAVRLGQGHSHLPGNVDYGLAVINHRGDYLNAPPQSDARLRMIYYFLDRYTFLDDKGYAQTESMAKAKIATALGDARRKKRSSSVAAARSTSKSQASVVKKKKATKKTSHDHKRFSYYDESSSSSSSSSDSELLSDNESEQESSRVKLIVRSGKNFSSSALPGNVAYTNETQALRGAYVEGDLVERERILAHFLDRFIFVHGSSDECLTKEAAKQKIHTTLRDSRLKRKSLTGSPHSPRPRKGSRRDS